ncbi:hypothetical protein P7K49_002655 [Saguinus oedipus]|uniref:Uncharacterized protein n=1 Tax=Saguinus oedipus TaxID=9490 RepID=A0ABQ9WK01_SAGOE|nr:hypothetical protein P7K49_002655 [Saguinus oedipus]
MVWIFLAACLLAPSLPTPARASFPNHTSDCTPQLQRPSTGIHSTPHPRNKVQTTKHGWPAPVNTLGTPLPPGLCTSCSISTDSNSKLFPLADQKTELSDPLSLLTAKGISPSYYDHGTPLPDKYRPFPSKIQWLLLAKKVQSWQAGSPDHLGIARLRGQSLLQDWTNSRVSRRSAPTLGRVCAERA